MENKKKNILIVLILVLVITSFIFIINNKKENNTNEEINNIGNIEDIKEQVRDINRSIIGQSAKTWTFTTTFLDELDVDIRVINMTTLEVFPYSINDSRTNNGAYRFKVHANLTYVNNTIEDRTYATGLNRNQLNKTYIINIPENVSNFTFYIGESSTIIQANVGTLATAYSPSSSICYDNNGVYHVAYEGADSDLWYGNSTDYGTTWSTKELLAGTITSVGITCNPNNNILVYAFDTPFTSDIYYYNSTNGGASFTQKTLASSLSSDTILSCVTNSVNNIQCATIQSSSAYFVNDTTGGISLLSASDSDNIDIAVDSNNNVFVAIVDSTTDTLTIMSSIDNFGSRNTVCDGGGVISGLPYQNPTINIRPNGRIDMAYIESSDLWYANGSNNSLTSWSCGEIDSTASLSPDIAVTLSDEIVILYQDATDSSGNVVFANSTNNGSSWNVGINKDSGGWASISQSRFSNSNNISQNLSYVFTGGTGSDDVLFSSFQMGNAETGGGGDSCTYTSGDWNIVASDNCVISSNVVIDSGNNITCTGTGTFTVQNNVNITGWSYRNFGRSCYYQAFGNGGFYT